MSNSQNRGLLGVRPTVRRASKQLHEPRYSSRSRQHTNELDVYVTRSCSDVTVGLRSPILEKDPHRGKMFGYLAVPAAKAKNVHWGQTSPGKTAPLQAQQATLVQLPGT